MKRSRRNPDSVISQIAVNTSQDVVLALLGCAIVGGVIYLIIKKSSDTGSDVGQAIADWTSQEYSSLFPGAGQHAESTTPYGDTAEQGPAGSVVAGAAPTEGGTS